MYGKRTLLEYLKSSGLKNVASFSNGALVNPGRFSVAAVETDAAILFADLPGYSRMATEIDGVECAYLVSHFYTWFDQGAKPYGALIDKFIGDELMLVFPADECEGEPLRAAIHAAHAMLDGDAFGFSPKIGIAHGRVTIAIVGTNDAMSVTALGETVNLAARCVQGLETQTIRVATEDTKLAASIFDTQSQRWSICGPCGFTPKNMDKTQVLIIERNTVFVPQFNYREDLRKAATFARENGAVIER
jgi:class 3 adenylate cyclase